MFVSRKSLFTVIIAPERNSSDASSASKPKRSRGVLSISEKMKILDMIEIKKKSYAEIARLYGKNESSIREVMKNKQTPVLAFLYQRKLQKLLLYSVIKC